MIHRHALPLLIAAGLLLCSTTLTAASAEKPATAVGARVDGAVIEAFKSSTNGRATVLIKLDEQADLSAAAAIKDWDERGWAVYRALSGTARSTQQPVLAQLRSAEAAGEASKIRSFWIVNVISVEASRATIDAIAANPSMRRPSAARWSCTTPRCNTGPVGSRRPSRSSSTPPATRSPTSTTR